MDQDVNAIQAVNVHAKLTQVVNLDAALQQQNHQSDFKNIKLEISN